MKKSNIKYLAAAIAMLSVLYSCTEEGFREPLGSSGPADPVTNITVKNAEGKSTLFYDVPADADLLYVKAVYTITNGQQLETKASYYIDSLVLEGFADETDGKGYEVKVYSVNRAKVESEPITVTVNPLRAPIYDILESVYIKDAFGGYKLSAENETAAPVAILILEQNEFKDWEVNNNLSVYSDNISILSTASGMDTIAREYGVVVRDRWGNLTDTLYQEVTPIYETEINRGEFAHYPLPGDVPMVSNGGVVTGLWDNRYGWPVCFTSLDAAYSSIPAVVTIDMGLEAKVSKVWIRPFQELSGLYYDYCTPKKFQFWGSSSPNPNGELDGTWTLLGEYEMKKPSGSSGKTETAADKEAAANGFFYEADLDAPRMRYLRIKNLENWSGFGTLALDELRVYGDPR